MRLRFHTGHCRSHAVIGTACALAALAGCGRTLETTQLGVVQGAAPEPSEANGSMAMPEPDPAPTPAGTLGELAALPHRPVSDSPQTAPACATPSETQFSAATYGAQAVRLVWDAETGACELLTTDRTPSGLGAILTLRARDGQVSLSAVGQWRLTAPDTLDLANVPPDQAFTVYPSLDEWQFVATLTHDGSHATLVDFAYLRGSAPPLTGQREALPDRAPSEYHAPTLCAPAPSNSEAESVP